MSGHSCGKRRLDVCRLALLTCPAAFAGAGVAVNASRFKSSGAGSWRYAETQDNLEMSLKWNFNYRRLAEFSWMTKSRNSHPFLFGSVPSGGKGYSVQTTRPQLSKSARTRWNPNKSRHVHTSMWKDTNECQSNGISRHEKQLTKPAGHLFEWILAPQW